MLWCLYEEMGVFHDIRNVYVFPLFFYENIYVSIQHICIYYSFFKVSVLQKAKYGNINAIFYTKKFSIWSMEKNLKVFMTLLWTKYMISKWNFLKRHVWSKLNFLLEKLYREFFLINCKQITICIIFFPHICRSASPWLLVTLLMSAS